MCTASNVQRVLRHHTPNPPASSHWQIQKMQHMISMQGGSRSLFLSHRGPSSHGVHGLRPLRLLRCALAARRPVLAGTHHERSTGKRRAWVCHAQPAQVSPPPSLNIQNVTSALMTAQKTFETYSGKKGSLSLKEAAELLNR